MKGGRKESVELMESWKRDLILFHIRECKCYVKSLVAPKVKHILFLFVNLHILWITVCHFQLYDSTFQMIVERLHLIFYWNQRARRCLWVLDVSHGWGSALMAEWSNALLLVFHCFPPRGIESWVWQVRDLPVTWNQGQFSLGTLVPSTTYSLPVTE